jgi:hypothetical protein
VNKEAGFLFTIDHPENWDVAANSSFNNAAIANNFISKDGKKNNLNIVIEQLPLQAGITEYVAASVEPMITAGMINGEPRVTYDLPSNSAMLYYQNLTTGGPTIQKFILNGNKAYLATANFSPLGGDDQTLSDMLKMISTFTLIGH